MATATLKKAVQKVSEAFSQEEEPILYHTDRRLIKEWNREQNYVLEAGNNLLRIYKAVAGFTIDTMADVAYINKDAVGFYKNQYFTENEKEFSTLTKLKLDFDSMIPIPKNFGEVIAARDRLRSYLEKNNPKFFAIENGEFTLTDIAYEKRNRQAYLYATTKEEKHRLAIALDIKKSLTRLEETLPDRRFADEAKRMLKYAYPLPYQLRVVMGENGPEISPFPKWILEGWGGTAHLGVALPTMRERKEARIEVTKRLLGEKFKKIQVIDVSGMPTGDYILCKPDEVSKHTFGPFRIKKNVVLDGYFNAQGQPYGEPLKPNTILNATSFSEKMIANIKD